MPSTIGIVASYASVFSPLELSPVLWLDASDTSTITASLGAVSQWNDKSGNAFNVTQATGVAQPATGSRTQNGLNVLDFDGGDELRSAASITQIRTSKALTQFVVMKSDRTSTASEGIVGAESGTFDFNTGWLSERRTTFLAWTVGSGSTSQSASEYNAARFSNSSTSPLIFTTQISAAAGTKAAYINSTSQTLTTFDGSMTNANFMSVGSAAHRLNVGSRGSLTGNHFDGWIAEIILYDASLSDTNRQLVIDYLVVKWGI